MATVEALHVGDRIADKYIIERVLGKGGMGMVVAARHVDLDQMVAIKFILPDALRQQGVVERLLREARASAKLRSEHVAKVTDVGRTPDGAPYLVMELLEGRDLAQMLDERTVIPASEAALYVGQACEAIAEAHVAGIIHRDIKPANLFLVARRDGSPCVKVLDFGIAKEDSLVNAAMTSTGSVLGTPMYMSPEQVRSSKTATPATDIWALGITLYELTTGHIPYDVTTVTELIAKILTEAPIGARVRNPSLSQEMDAVIMRCLQVDPSLRYRSATELQAALAPLTFQSTTGVKGLSSFTSPGSATVGVFPAHPVAGHTPPAPQPSLAGAVLVGAPVLASSRILPQTTESSTSVAIHPSKGSSKAPLIALAVVAVLGALGGGAAFMLTRTPASPIAAASSAPTPSPQPPPDEVAPEPAATPAAPAAPDAAPEPSADVAPADSAAPAPSADPAPSASAKVEPPRNPSKRPAAPPRAPDRPAPTPTAKPGWGGLL